LTRPSGDTPLVVPTWGVALAEAVSDHAPVRRHGAARAHVGAVLEVSDAPVEQHAAGRAHVGVALAEAARPCGADAPVGQHPTGRASWALCSPTPRATNLTPSPNANVTPTGCHQPLL